MGTIYYEAKGTIIWLGESDEDTKRLFFYAGWLTFWKENGRRRGLSSTLHRVLYRAGKEELSSLVMFSH
jgi:hypothetical protein